MGIITGGRRTRIVVDRKFQIGATAMGIVYILAVAIFLSLPLFDMMEHMDVLLQGHSAELAEFYVSQQNYTIVSMGLFITGILGAWTVFSLWRTHKVAGPLVKITRFVHHFATGNFEDRIVLRDKDQLQALARALNDMAASLEERDRAIRTEILDQIEAVRCTLYDSSSTDHGVQALERLAARVDRSFDAMWEGTVPEEDIHHEPIHT